MLGSILALVQGGTQFALCSGFSPAGFEHFARINAVKHHIVIKIAIGESTIAMIWFCGVSGTCTSAVAFVIFVVFDDTISVTISTTESNTISTEATEGTIEGTIEDGDGTTEDGDGTTEATEGTTEATEGTTEATIEGTIEGTIDAIEDGDGTTEDGDGTTEDGDGAICGAKSAYISYTVVIFTVVLDALVDSLENKSF